MSFQHYMDNNATTFMPDIVMKSMIKWCNKGNTSAHYATESRNLIETLKNTILNDNDMHNHTAIITSGASESNSQIIISSLCSFMKKTSALPHIISSSLEHKSILSTLENYKDYGLCEYSLVHPRLEPEVYGQISPFDLDKLIKPNTCLISIMSANNETGIMNDIPALTAIAHKYKIPFHTDCTQSFGKFGVYSGVDACSISFHKLYGPPGIGLLILKNNFMHGYGLKSLIGGTQNSSLRGGTENIIAIGGAYAAYRYNSINRQEKNNYLLALRNYTKKIFSKYFRTFNITDFSTDIKQPAIFFIEPKKETSGELQFNSILPNTLMIGVYQDYFCNIQMKEELEKYGIIISIGSACNTSSSKVSHVIKTLEVPVSLYGGIFRISFSDETTKNSVTYMIGTFANLFNEAIKPPLPTM